MKLSRILLFPIKSLDGVSVDSVRVTDGGILENDRIYALFDEAGEFVDGKRSARVYDLRSEFDEDLRHVRLGDNRAEYELTDVTGIEAWLGFFFGFPIFLRADPSQGFPDDTVASGPTIVSEASLHEVASWYSELDENSIRLRFRSNLEISDVPAFWEDQLFGAQGVLKTFHIGDVTIQGHNPCQRCGVPSHDPRTGEVLSGFQKIFMQERKATLPEWADARHFNHFYRFAVNTSIPATEAGKILRLGDLVRL